MDRQSPVLLLRRFRHALGLGEVDFVRPETLGRRSLTRFLQNLKFLGLSPASVLEICPPDVPLSETADRFGDANYLRLDPAHGMPVLCLRRTEAEFGPGSGNTGVADLCRTHGLKSPLYLFVSSDEEGVFNTEPFRSLPGELELAFLLVATERLGMQWRRVMEADSLLRASGMMLFDCLEHWRPALEGRVRRQVLVYARMNGRLAAIEQRRQQYVRPVAAEPSEVGQTTGMKSCFIMGMGRSGTSMLGGIMYEAGYYLGENLYPARPSNPKGFFECAMINCLNEDILARYRNISSAYTARSPARKLLTRMGAGGLFNPDNRRLQGWLCDIPKEMPVSVTDPSFDARISEVLARRPFCYKDPRFSYTLPVWRRHLDSETVFICMFREPAKTASSIVKECATMPYLRGLSMDMNTAFSVYLNAYGHLLKYNRDILDRILFVHYDQLVSGAALPRISRRIGVDLTAAFADRALSRSRDTAAVPAAAVEVYETLCELAGHD